MSLIRELHAIESLKDHIVGEIKDWFYPDELSDTLDSIIYLGGKFASSVSRDYFEIFINKLSKVDTYKSIEYWDTPYSHDPWIYGR